MPDDLLSSLGRERSGDSPQGPEDIVQCSRRGCQEAAVWCLEWNNPKVHTPDRRKLWTACGDHRDYLAEFLQVRGFLQDVTPL